MRLKIIESLYAASDEKPEKVSRIRELLKQLCRKYGLDAAKAVHRPLNSRYNRHTGRRGLSNLGLIVHLTTTVLRSPWRKCLRPSVALRLNIFAYDSTDNRPFKWRKESACPRNHDALIEKLAAVIDDSEFNRLMDSWTNSHFTETFLRSYRISKIIITKFIALLNMVLTKYGHQDPYLIIQLQARLWLILSFLQLR